MEYKDIKNCKLVQVQEKGHPFDGVGSETIVEIIELYYTEKLSVTKIIDKFGLNIDKVSKFSTYLPFFYTKENCPYDDSHLIAKLPSKSSLKYFSPDLCCNKCGHIEYFKSSVHCSCNNCQ